MSTIGFPLGGQTKGNALGRVGCILDSQQINTSWGDIGLAFVDIHRVMNHSARLSADITHKVVRQWRRPFDVTHRFSCIVINRLVYLHVYAVDMTFVFWWLIRWVCYDCTRTDTIALAIYSSVLQYC